MAKVKTALLIIDMLNPLDFKEGKHLLKRALPAAKALAKLKARAKTKKIPVIYVNDNFGRWKSDWREIYARCASDDSLGKPLAQLLQPEPDDLFVLKPKHSGFYSTNLDVLLRELKVKRLILTGIAGNICVLFTANDAHMRDYEVIVPRDCFASNKAVDDRYTIKHLSHVLGLQTPRSATLRLN
jgi:nicotinamidase-related amidase